MVWTSVRISLLSVPKRLPYLIITRIPAPGLIFAQLFFRNRARSFSSVNLQYMPISHYHVHFRSRSHLCRTRLPHPTVFNSLVNLQSSPLSHPSSHSRSRSRLCPPLLQCPIDFNIMREPSILKLWWTRSINVWSLSDGHGSEQTRTTFVFKQLRLVVSFGVLPSPQGNFQYSRAQLIPMYPCNDCSITLGKSTCKTFEQSQLLRSVNS